MKVQTINAEQAWILGYHYASTIKLCKSKTGIVYVLGTRHDAIHFNTPSRNDGIDEIVSKKLFNEFFESVKNLEVINTNTIKEIIPNALYKKRSPLITLLKSSEIIK